MSDPILKLTHVLDGLKRLLVQFHGQPNIEGILRSYLNQAQEIEVMLFALMAERYVRTAVGVQLDGVGKIVGELRAARVDDDYRVAIIGRIARNSADSKTEDIIALFVLLLPGHTFDVQDGPGPAAFTVRIEEALPATPPNPSPAVLNQQLQEAKGGGVGATLLWSEVDADETFTFADGDTLQASTTQGYADGPPQTIGGRYSDALG